MEQDFARALGTWTGFYAALSAVAATLLGLLFVALSLRLNLFQDAVVADVRDFAALVFGQFLALVLVGLVALFPDPKPATLGLPTLAIGALGLGWAVRLAGEYLHLNTAPGSRRGWSVVFFVVSLGAAIAFVAGGAALLLRGDAGPLPWVAAVDIATLAAAAVGAWLLLSHAKAG